MVKNLSSANATKYASTTAAGAQAAAQISVEKATQEAANLREKRAQEDYNYQARNLTALNAQAALLEQQQRAIETNNQKQTADEIKADARKAQLVDDARVQQAARMMGLDIPDRKTLKAMNEEKRNAVQIVMASDGVFGKDPASVWKALTYGNPAKMPPAVATQFQILSSVKKQAENEVMADPVLKTAAPKVQQEAVVQKMAAKIQALSVDPNATVTTPGGGQTDNPYHMPTPDAMAKNPATAGLALNDLITAQRKLLPNTPMTDGIIMELAYSEVGPGKKYANIQDAAREVSSYFKGGVDKNNKDMMFDHFGMPVQEIYKVKGIDATNYAAVMKYYITKDRMKSMSTAFGGADIITPSDQEVPAQMGGATFPIGTNQ
jgi:hypothetical protein